MTGDPVGGQLTAALRRKESVMDESHTGPAMLSPQTCQCELRVAGDPREKFAGSWTFSCDDFDAYVEEQTGAWCEYLETTYPPFDDFNWDDYAPTNCRWIGGGESGPAVDPSDFSVSAAELFENFAANFPKVIEFDGVKLDPAVGLLLLRAAAAVDQMFVDARELERADASWSD